MPRRVRISGLADEDLKNIYIGGFREFGESAADAYFLEIFDTFDLIARNPRLGRAATTVYRAHGHRSHLIVYRLIDDHEVEISRVLHARQDWRKLLG